MILPPFALHRPSTPDEAVALSAHLAEEGVRYVAGGTDLLQNLKHRIRPPAHLISLHGVEGMDRCEPGRVGALATLAQLERSKDMRDAHPGLLEAVAVVATPLIRQTATIGGNLLVDTRCHFLNQSPFWRSCVGSCLKAEGPVCRVVPGANECVAAFSSDCAPILQCLNASLSLLGPEGERTVSLRSLYRHDGILRHTLEAGEIIQEISIPPAEGLRSGYGKLRIRESWDYPLLGVAATLRLDGRQRVSSLSVSLGAIHTTPLIMDTATDPLVGSKLTDAAIASVAKRMRHAVAPKHTGGLTPGYRKRMVEVFARRLLTRLRDSG